MDYTPVYTMTRPYGYGSIWQRSSDGRWFATIQITVARGEKRRRKTLSGPTREIAESKLATYRAEHPAREHLGNRAEWMERARALGTHTEREYWAKVRAAGARCEYCLKIIKLDFHGDHKTPVSRGGSDSIDNIAVSCGTCNIEKGTMTVEEYAAWKLSR